MSPPTALLVSRYRAFARDEALPLRPLTLLYGRNNSGKSALSRAIAMLGASVARDVKGALVIPPELLRKGTFSDLAWQGDAGDYSFDLGLRWDDGELREARYTLDGGPGRESYVKELMLRGEGGELSWSGIAAPGRPMKPLGHSSGGEVSFVGLVPQRSDVPAVRMLAARMVALRGRVQARPPSGSGGEGGPRRRSPDHPRPEGPRDLQDRSGGHGRGHGASAPRARGRRSGGPMWNGQYTHRGGAGEPPPPDAQSVLARHLCAIAARPDAPTLVLETHSRIFLLGVQLAVANGLPPERVGLTWIDQDATGRSTITPVELSPSGHPRAGWPVAALGEDLRLASELARLDLQRAD